MHELTDETLIERARNSASETERNRYVEQLFERHYKRVALWCLRWSHDRELARDLTQEVFLKVHRSLDGFVGSAKFSTWLYTVARNHCLNAARDAWEEETLGIGEFLAETTASKEPSPEWRAEQNNQLDIARQMISDNLDDIERQVMLLHYVEELPLPVVTRMLQLTNASGAKAFMVSGQRKLKSAVARWRARHASRGIAG